MNKDVEIEKRFSALKIYANGLRKKIGSLEKGILHQD